MITIVDSKIGNIGAIANMLRHLGFKSRFAASPDELRGAEKLILPGVGAFDKGMASLRERGFIEPLNELVLERRVPVLGICLGMQLLANGSEEGTSAGLGWIDADVVRFRFDGRKDLKIPHMGWNHVAPLRELPLLAGVDAGYRFYFVHSYHFRCRVEEDSAAVTDYGLPFTSIAARNNVYGVQFHPEKSHRYGMRLLGNFARLP